MNARNICISKFDKERLENLFSTLDESGCRNRTDLRELKEEVRRAQALDPKDVPPEVVTMNSRVRLRDLDSDEIVEYTLVFPKDADFEVGRISIMSAVGTAILGYSVGDVVEWTVPAGQRRLKIEALPYQPEKAGDYHL